MIEVCTYRTLCAAATLFKWEVFRHVESTGTVDDEMMYQVIAGFSQQDRMVKSQIESAKLAMQIYGM